MSQTSPAMEEAMTRAANFPGLYSAERAENARLTALLGEAEKALETCADTLIETCGDLNSDDGWGDEDARDAYFEAIRVLNKLEASK